MKATHFPKKKLPILSKDKSNPFSKEEGNPFIHGATYLLLNDSNFFYKEETPHLTIRIEAS